MAPVNQRPELWLGQIRVRPQDAILTCCPGVGSREPMSYDARVLVLTGAGERRPTRVLRWGCRPVWKGR